VPRVVVHHAHHPDEGDGVYRLIHAEQTEHTVYELGESKPVKRTVLKPNPDFVAAPPSMPDDLDPNELDEDQLAVFFDDRTDEQKKPMLEEEVEVPGPPDIIEHTVTVHHDHKEIIWDATDKRWKDKSPEEIAQIQQDIVSKQIAKDAKAAKAEAKKAANVKDLGSAGATL
jgi:hypothetical protein